MADVFISYSKHDVANTRMLASLLEASGYTVWWDANLEGGDQFRNTIVSELAKARAVVVIWTKNSIVSDWVQSEAGRALGDQKLVPVRTSEIEYNEIPPPFETRHTLKLSQTEEILAAVAGQLAKPIGVGPRWKVLRYELLLWLGVLGGAITLTNIISGTFTLSAALLWVIANWSALLKYFWQALMLFKIEVSPYDAEFLTIGVLMTSAIFYASSRRPSSRKIRTTSSNETEADRFFAEAPAFLALCSALFSILVILGIGAVDIGDRETAKDRRAWERLHQRLFVDRRDCEQAVIAARGEKPFYMTPGGEPQWYYHWTEEAIRKVLDCLKPVPTTELSRRERVLVEHFPPTFGFGNGSLWVAFVTSAPSDVCLIVFGIAAVLSPIFLPFIIYLRAASILRLKLNVPVLSRRLWRTLVLFAGILMFNFVALWLETSLKAIPSEL